MEKQGSGVQKYCNTTKLEINNPISDDLLDIKRKYKTKPSNSETRNIKNKNE